MKACSQFCTTLMVLLVFCTALGQAPQSSQATSLPVGSATISEIKGALSLRGPDGASITGKAGVVLPPESTIETEKGSILLLLQDGSQVLVKQNSRVVLKAPDQGKGYFLELFIGKVINKIQKRLGSNPSFRMGTPTAVITVRGTQFEVDVNKKLRTSVVVYEGLVEVSSSGGNFPPVLIRPGFFTDVERDRAPRPPHEVGGREGAESGNREGPGLGGDREAPQSGQRPSGESSGRDD